MVFYSDDEKLNGKFQSNAFYFFQTNPKILTMALTVEMPPTVNLHTDKTWHP